MNEGDEMKQLKKITGQITQWKPALSKRNLMKERIAQAKAEIAERAKGQKGAERGQLVAEIYKRHLRIKE